MITDEMLKIMFPYTKSVNESVFSYRPIYDFRVLKNNSNLNYNVYEIREIDLGDVKVSDTSRKVSNRRLECIMRDGLRIVF